MGENRVVGLHREEGGLLVNGVLHKRYDHDGQASIMLWSNRGFSFMLKQNGLNNSNITYYLVKIDSSSAFITSNIVPQ